MDKHMFPVILVMTHIYYLYFFAGDSSISFVSISFECKVWYESSSNLTFEVWTYGKCVMHMLRMAIWDNHVVYMRPQ